MAFASLEDETGKIELVIFPKVYSSFREVWLRDRVVIVEGKVERREEDLTIIAEAGRLVSSEEKSKHDFVIRVPKGISSKTLVDLNTLLKSNLGEKMGILVFENGNGGPVKKLALSFGVNYNSSLKIQIESLLKK